MSRPLSFSLWIVAFRNVKYSTLVFRNFTQFDLSDVSLFPLYLLEGFASLKSLVNLEEILTLQFMQKNPSLFLETDKITD